jgi:replicative DNA helicase
MLTALDILTPGDFFVGLHERTFEAIANLQRDSIPVDPISLKDVLYPRGNISDGLKTYIAELFEDPTGEVGPYIDIVERDSIRRRTIRGAREIQSLAWNETDTDTLLSQASQLALSITRNGGSGPTTVSRAATDFWDELEFWAQNPLGRGEVRGLPTYIPRLDNLLAGMQVGEEIIICGRPSMGKSALAMEIALRMGLNGHNILIFSLEMSKKQIVARWASSRSGVQTDRMRRGILPAGGDARWHVSQEEFDRYLDAVMQFMGMRNILIDDTPALTLQQIRSRAIRVSQEMGHIDALVVDHGGLARTTFIPGENTAKTEGRKGREVRNLGKELGAVSILLWQLNRLADGVVPELKHLRDSGELEQDADVVLGLYRDEYYNPSSTDRPQQLDILSLKQRDGMRNTRAVVRYEAEYQRFSELTQQLEFEEGW